MQARIRRSARYKMIPDGNKLKRRTRLRTARVNRCFTLLTGLSRLKLGARALAEKFTPPCASVAATAMPRATPKMRGDPLGDGEYGPAKDLGLRGPLAVDAGFEGASEIGLPAANPNLRMPGEHDNDREQGDGGHEIATTEDLTVFASLGAPLGCCALCAIVRPRVIFLSAP